MYTQSHFFNYVACSIIKSTSDYVEVSRFTVLRSVLLSVPTAWAHDALGTGTCAVGL